MNKVDVKLRAIESRAVDSAIENCLLIAQNIEKIGAPELMCGQCKGYVEEENDTGACETCKLCIACTDSMVFVGAFEDDKEDEQS